MKTLQKYWITVLTVVVLTIFVMVLWHLTNEAIRMAVGGQKADDSMQNYAASAGVIISFATAVLLLFTIFFTGLMLRETQNAVKEAQRLNVMTEANERPIIGVRFPNPFILRTDKSLFASENKFVVVNMGRTAAKITSIYREWCGTNEGFPPPLDPTTANEKFCKEWSRHVGGGGETEAIWMGGNGFEKLFPDGTLPSRVFFRGRICFEDMNGGKHECIFTYFVNATDNERRFAMCWPSEDHERYNSCRRLSKV